jgi:uncharacterized protein YbaA (DUF1428 family)
MRYVDGFLLAVPRRNLQAYRQMSAKAGRIWREHGALEYRECVADDLDAKKAGKTFARGLRLRTDEVVVFSWIVYRSRAHRDRVNKKVMADPRIEKITPPKMPFDMKRMAYGGFRTIVDQANN